LVLLVVFSMNNWITDVPPEELIDSFVHPNEIDIEDMGLHEGLERSKLRDEDQDWVIDIPDDMWSGDLEAIAEAVCSVPSDKYPPIDGNPYRDDSFEEITADSFGELEEVKNNEQNRRQKTMETTIDPWGTVRVLKVENPFYISNRKTAYEIAKQLGVSMSSHSFGDNYVAYIRGDHWYEIENGMHQHEINTAKLSLDDITTTFSKCMMGMFYGVGKTSILIDKETIETAYIGNMRLADESRFGKSIGPRIMGENLLYPREIQHIAILRAFEIAIFMLGTYQHEENRLLEYDHSRLALLNWVLNEPRDADDQGDLSDFAREQVSNGWPWKDINYHPDMNSDYAPLPSQSRRSSRQCRRIDQISPHKMYRVEADYEGNQL